MIVLNIQSDNRGKLEEVAQMLLADKLVIDVNIQSDIERFKLDGGKPVKRLHHVMRARTKALLFPAIERRLKEKYRDGMPELFSVPIVHMDWDQMNQLRTDIEGI